LLLIFIGGHVERCGNSTPTDRGLGLLTGFQTSEKLAEKYWRVESVVKEEVNVKICSFCSFHLAENVVSASCANDFREELRQAGKTRPTISHQAAALSKSSNTLLREQLRPFFVSNEIS